jgi:hypothetical protein
VKLSALLVTVPLVLSAPLTHADNKNPWPDKFSTAKLRLDFSPGAMNVTVASANFGPGTAGTTVVTGLTQWSATFTGSPNVDPLNGMPWRSMPAYTLELRFGNDNHLYTTQQCLAMAEQVAVLPPSSPRRFRIEIGFDQPMINMDPQNYTRVSTHDVGVVSCSIL